MSQVLKINAKTREALQGALPFPRGGVVKFSPQIEDVEEEFLPVFHITQPTKDDADIFYKKVYKDVEDIDSALAKCVSKITNVYDFDSDSFVDIAENLSSYFSGLSTAVKVGVFLKIGSLCRISVYEKAGLGQ